MLESLRTMILLLLCAAGFAFFALGFSARHLGWHNWFRPYILYALGRTGGCSLRVSRAFGRERLWKAKKGISSRSKLLKAADEFELWGTPRGVFWIPANFQSFFYILAEQEIKIYGAGSHGVRPGDIVLDCGANIGVFSMEALSLEAKLVVAVEPSPKKVECLRRNFASQIAAGRLVVYPKGVWKEDATLPMSLYKNGVLDSFVIDNRSVESLGTVQLPVTTVDQLVADLELPRVDFIKMDVEGSNLNALSGAGAVLAKYKPRLVISTEDLADDYLTVPSTIARANPAYQCVRGHARLKSRFQIVPDVLYFF